MPLKAGVVQFSPLYGSVEPNLSRLHELVVEGASQGAELLVLPEMAWTGYLWPSAEAIRPLSERPLQSAVLARLQEWSRDLRLALVFGFPEDAGDNLFNSQLLVTPDEHPHPIYRKTHLFDADTWWASEGDTGYRQWSWAAHTLGSGICMDLNFPDLVEYHRRERTEILCFSTNWLDQGFDVIPYWEAQLTGEEGGYSGWALFANRGGSEWGVEFRGQSSVFYQGRQVAGFSGKEDGVLVVGLNSLPERPM